MPKLAVSAVYQWHVMVEPEELFGAQAIGAQGEHFIAGHRGRGLAFTVLAALSAGRTETPVPETKARNGSVVNALAGVFLARGGSSLRLAFDRVGAIVASATIGGRFPEPQLELELDVGVEYGL
jgi:hypothetical protein